MSNVYKMLLSITYDSTNQPNSNDNRGSELKIHCLLIENRNNNIVHCS